MLIRPLPNGHVIAVDPNSFLDPADKKTMEGNIVTLKDAYGNDPNKVFTLKEQSQDALFVNSWIWGKYVFVPQIDATPDPEDRNNPVIEQIRGDNKRALETYRTALGKDYTVIGVTIQFPSAAAGTRGAFGGIHCMSSTIWGRSFSQDNAKK